MKKLLFSIVLLLLSYCSAKAQPYLTVNNNTSCSLIILARAAVPTCTNPILTNPTVPPGQTILNLTAICVCTPTGYEWVSSRVADGCGNDTAVGDGFCNPFSATSNITIAACAGGCGNVPVKFTPTGGGDATVDIN